MNTSLWKKQMLSAPSLEVLSAALALLRDPVFTGTLQQAISQALSAHYKAAVPDSVNARLTQDVAFNDVRVEYIRQFRQQLFGGGLMPDMASWWFSGNRKSDRANRVKALEKFTLAAVEAGKSQNRVFKVYLDGSTPRVVEAQRVGSGKSTITILYADGTERTERISGPLHAWRDTWEEASQVLVAFAREKLEDARRALQKAQAYEGNCRGMKRKSVVTSESGAPPSALTAAIAEALGGTATEPVTATLPATETKAVEPEVRMAGGSVA